MKSETIEKSSSSEGDEFEDSSQELSSPNSNRHLSNLGQPSQFQELQLLLDETQVSGEDFIRKKDSIYKKSSLIPEALPLFSLPT